ncbi:TetR/AcrR family transcriptional regulator [Mycolicibacterium hodleri]|uniref:TetR/AcrR family transcriptional regulator n=1 Tax=Mycolicibacterium hodleri TaxID=49897 RepID=A0A502ELB4_9MYCO|nr:TetR/AcrR family transcriptional regulator [Mycolicibacterium hodleri]TPG37266.1 TetR/AcrR family transcriptional regulator [Mycolicibacterium hodleri]
MTAVVRRPAPTRRAENRQRRGDDTRAVIIAETVACILEEGFGAASAKHITERANVSWGVIQYHFGDRDQLLMAVVDEGFAGLQRALAHVHVPNGALRERVSAVVEAAWPAFSNPTSMAAQEILVATRVTRGKKLNRHLVDVNEGLNALGAKLVPDQDGSAVADVIWACLRGLTVPQMVSAGRYDSTRQRQTLIDMLTLYLSAESLFDRRR